VAVTVFVPTFGMGVERKFNSKWGATVEASVPLVERQVKSYKDETDHRIKAQSINIKLMATYSLVTAFKK
jgi:hypothetical protein